MNSRCQKDALDRAEDICELCGLQYCAQCLVFPRGHRNPPTCKTCALKNSGLRGSSGKTQPISKREYKKRKKALLEQLENVADEQPAIEYFELHDPSQFDRSTELDRRIAEIEAEAPIDILAPDEPSTPDMLPAPVPPPPAPAPVPAPAATPDPGIDDQALAGLAPVDTSVNPLALDGPSSPPSPAAPSPAAGSPSPPPPAAPEPTGSSAADLLARLKADQPIQSQFTSIQPSLDADPFATAPTPEPTRAQQSSAPQPGVPQPEAPQPVAPRPGVPQPVAPQPAASGTAAPGASGSWSPPAPPPRGTKLDVESPANDQPSFDDPPSGSPQEPEGETPQRRAADTDASGQWIPPSLRGMADPESRPPLPKRR